MESLNDFNVPESSRLDKPVQIPSQSNMMN